MSSPGLSWLASVLLCLSPSFCAAAHPNIVFILADDLGYGDVGCYNTESKAPTPNIDRLAEQGMRFTDAHAPGSVCVPTRYGLMTGRYPFRRDLKSSPKIDAGRLTIASLLQRHGYSTAMIGKWHLGFKPLPPNDWSQLLRGGPLDRGFEKFFGIHASLDISPYYYIRGRRPIEPPTGQIGAKNTAGWTRVQGEFWRAGPVAPRFKHAEVLPRFGEEAVDVINQHKKGKNDKPLFLYVALTAPHTPWLPLNEYRGKSSADLYGDFVTQVDATVGTILKALDSNELSEDTLVIFTSDNGPVWFPQDVTRFDHRATGPLRGMKGDSWEGGHRMPFIARWPNHTPASSTCQDTICFTDMLATFAAIVEAEPPSDTLKDSYNILPLLHGEKPHKPIRNVTIHRRDASAIRMGGWKLITHPGSGGMSDRYSDSKETKGDPSRFEGQLYDLEADLGETKNLWADRPDVVKQLTTLLQEYTREAN